MLKEDCLDLPPKVFTTRTVELSDEQKEIFKVMYNSWGGPKDPIKPRRKKKRGGKV